MPHLEKPAANNPFNVTRSVKSTAREALCHLEDVDLADLTWDMHFEQQQAVLDVAARRESMRRQPERRLDGRLLDGSERMQLLNINLPSGFPAYKIAADSEFLHAIHHIEKDRLANGRSLDISPAVLAIAGIGCTLNAVDSLFTSDAMNAINMTYYSTEGVAFAPESRLANLYVSNRPLNYAIGLAIAEHASSRHGETRIKELCSGDHLQQWRHRLAGLASDGRLKTHITVTDFMEPPEKAAPGVLGATFETEAYSLLEDMPHLNKAHRYDAMVTTYGFDSVWQPEDAHIVHDGDKWYQSMYRAKISDLHPRRYDMQAAIMRGEPLSDACPSDFDGIAVERVLQKIDPWEHPYGFFIVGHDKESFSFPGGLIKRVVNAFEAQLNRDGAFISCDSGNFGQELPYCYDAGMTGIGARYRMDDYVIAKEVLEAVYGLEVTLLTLPELAEQYLPPEWVAEATEDEIYGLAENPTNGMMIVKNPPQNHWFDEVSGKFKE